MSITGRLNHEQTQQRAAHIERLWPHIADVEHSIIILDGLDPIQPQAEPIIETPPISYQVPALKPVPDSIHTTSQPVKEAEIIANDPAMASEAYKRIDQAHQQTGADTLDTDWFKQAA